MNELRNTKTGDERRKWRTIPLVIAVLMLGVIACLCGPLSGVFPGAGEAEEEVTVEEEAEAEPTEAPPTAAEEPEEEPVEEEEAEAAPSSAMVISAENAGDVEQVMEFAGAEQVSFGLAVSPDGSQVAVFGFDGTIRIFDVEAGSEVQSLTGGHSGPGWGLAYSPDGTLLASGGEDFRLVMWDVESGDDRFNFVAETDPGDMAFTPDGSKLVFVGFNSSRVFVIDAEGNDVGTIEEHGRVLGSVDVSRDGAWIASGNSRGNIVVSDADTLATVTTLNEGTGTLWATKFSPDGAWLAAGSGSGDIWVWDTTSWGMESEWLAHGGGVQYLAWSVDGSVLVSVGTDGNVILWNPTTGRELNSFHYTDGTVWKVVFAQDGSYFATLGGDKAMVRIFGLP